MAEKANDLVPKFGIIVDHNSDPDGDVVNGIKLYYWTEEFALVAIDRLKPGESPTQQEMEALEDHISENGLKTNGQEAHWTTVVPR